MRIVQIGLGRWGEQHARILSKMGVLGAVCDIDSKKSQEYGEKYSVNYYTSLDDTLESEEFDVAFVVTPTPTHWDITKRLLEAKKHVFVERPMTYESQDGQELVNLAEKKKVILTCGYIERFNPAVDIVKKMLKDKSYGEPVMLEFHRENQIPPDAANVGIICHTAIHDIDTANWLLGEMPNLVFVRAGKIRHEHEDYSSITLGYKDNKVAVISSNWITPKRVRRFSVMCTAATISSDFVSQEVTIQGEQPHTIQNEKHEPLLLEIQSFLDAINQKTEPIVRPQEAVNVTKIAEAALLSSLRGVPIYLDLK